MSPKYLVAAVVAALLSAPVSAQSVKAGIEAWQRADYPAAVAIWRPLAEGGDADAQFNLGQAYRLGRGVTINLSAAKTWFERAATSGHLDAQTTLGLLLFYNGDGVTQDRLLGYAFVSRAAAQGLSPAKDTLEQLDELMPAADRQKALALARSIPNGSPVAPKAAKPSRSA